MLVDFLVLGLLGGAVVAGVLLIGQRGLRRFRRDLDRLAVRRGWRVSPLPGHTAGRMALRLVPSDDADWSLTLQETSRQRPGGTTARRFRKARFHSPSPAWADGWLVVVPGLPGKALGAAALGAVSGGRLSGDAVLRQRLAAVLPEAALTVGAPQPVDLPGLPDDHTAWIVGAVRVWPAGLDAARLAAALSAFRGTGRSGHVAPSVALGPDGLHLVAGLPVHGLDPAAAVLERLADCALALRAGLLRG